VSGLGNDTAYNTPAPAPVLAEIPVFALAELRLQKSVTLAEKSKYHLVKFLGNLTWVCNASRNTHVASSRIAREIAILLVGSDMGGQSFFRADQDGVCSAGTARALFRNTCSPQNRN